jgi:hypothetical protein
VYTVLVIICSLLLKKWYEQENAKWYPVMIAKNIELEALRQQIRVHIRARGAS